MSNFEGISGANRGNTVDIGPALRYVRGPKAYVAETLRGAAGRGWQRIAALT